MLDTWRSPVFGYFPQFLQFNHVPRRCQNSQVFKVRYGIAEFFGQPHPDVVFIAFFLEPGCDYPCHPVADVGRHHGRIQPVKGHFFPVKDDLKFRFVLFPAYHHILCPFHFHQLVLDLFRKKVGGVKVISVNFHIHRGGPSHHLSGGGENGGDNFGNLAEIGPHGIRNLPDASFALLQISQPYHQVDDVGTLGLEKGEHSSFII